MMNALNPVRFGKIAWYGEGDNQALLRAFNKDQVFIVDVDTQNDFIFKNKEVGQGLYVPQAESIIPNVLQIRAAGSRLKLPVIASIDTHNKEDLELNTYPPHCIKGTYGWAKVDGTGELVPGKKPYTIVLDPKVDDVPSSRQLKRLVQNDRPVHIQKNTLSVGETAVDKGGPFGYVDWLKSAKSQLFFETLKYTGRKVGIVMGVATEYCVKKAVETLKSHGFTPIVVEDAVKHAGWDALNDPTDSIFEETKVMSTAQFVELAQKAAAEKATASASAPSTVA